MKIKIFVEGSTDKKFTEDYLVFLGLNPQKKIIVIDCEGKTKLHLIKSQFIPTGEGKNLVLFDADGNREASVKYLQDKRTELGIEFELFLFPNNNDLGEIEDLFFQITKSEHATVLTCFDNYLNCLPDTYQKPEKVAKIYAYMDAIIPDKESFKNPSKRNYLDPIVWNLNADVLSALRDFLITNISE